MECDKDTPARRASFFLVATESTAIRQLPLVHFPKAMLGQHQATTSLPAPVIAVSSVLHLNIDLAPIPRQTAAKAEKNTCGAPK